jgi:G3E family GTPase
MNSQDSPTPVTLVLGLSAPAKGAVLAALRAVQGDDQAWAWLLQDLPPPIASTSDNVGTYLRLSNACICCLGQAELQVQLPKLLRAGRWRRMIIELASSSHPAKVLDFLRTKPWRTRLDIQQVLLAIDAEHLYAYKSVANEVGATVAHLLARAQLLASTHRLSVNLNEGALANLDASLAQCDLYSDLLPINTLPATIVAQLSSVLMSSATQNQFTRADSSCNFRTSDSNSATNSASNESLFEIYWSPLRVFDRRRVMTVVNDFAQSNVITNAMAIFATERAWYEWRVIDSRREWQETEYRVRNVLRIKLTRATAHEHSLRDLQIAIDDTITN